MMGMVSGRTAQTILTLLSVQAMGFDLNMYSTWPCTGLSTTETATVANGCSTARAGQAEAIINRWSNETDNKLLLGTYSDSVCCHANLIETYSWTDGCTKLTGGFQSWRVLDPNEPDKGKAGEKYDSCFAS